LLERHADEVIDDGRRGLVRNGYLPEREIMTGIGPVAVRCRRMRDRVGEGSERIRFSLPYARRSKSLEVPIPILYLKGTSTGEFEEAQVALLWFEERVRWSKRDLWSSSGARPRAKRNLSDLSMAQRTSSKTHSQRSAIAPCPRGASLNKTALAMIYKLAGVAEGAGSASTVTISCSKVMLGVKFTDGVKDQIASSSLSHLILSVTKFDNSSTQTQGWQSHESPVSGDESG
jgi:hypothetical protein